MGFASSVPSGRVHHPDAEALREYDRQCYETLVEHWADKILSRETRAEQQAQVEATPAKIKQAARLRALEKLQEQRQEKDDARVSADKKDC